MKSPRINITVEESLANFLLKLAHHEHKSLSCLTKELVIEALEKREDYFLSTLGEIRDTPNAKTIKHNNAWK